MSAVLFYFLLVSYRILRPLLPSVDEKLTLQSLVSIVVFPVRLQPKTLKFNEHIPGHHQHALVCNFNIQVLFVICFIGALTIKEMCAYVNIHHQSPVIGLTGM